ncbi:M6 family metalloprotease domain-containing protein [Prevotella dentasini]
MAKIQKVRKKAGDFGVANTELYKGVKQGLIILAQYPDKKFKPSNDKTYYDKIANERGFSDDNGFKGSIRDYFYAQSSGIFDLQFKVVGPVTLPQSYAYYGKDDESGEDSHVGQMIAEACQLAANEVDFKQFDWDGDGKAEQVYVIYAGEGAHASMDNNTIWPCSWTLSESDYGKSVTLNGVIVDQFATSNEVTSKGTIEGIGTICHEFSHCIGFPDAYDVSYGGSFGMGNWDLMDNGNYAGNGFVPVGYTAYEKMLCGWTTPVELLGDTIVTGIKPISLGGQTYIIYNKANKDEYYLLENRQRVGWDAYLPGTGILVTHIDYDKEIFAKNLVNAIGDFTSFAGVKNDHQRYTVVHADNDDDSEYWSEMMHTHMISTEAGDTYPYDDNDSLSNKSLPAAMLYNKNFNGHSKLNVNIRNMAIAEDGTASFAFTDFSNVPHTLPDIPGIVFYESFDECEGVGGNDGDFYSGNAGQGTFYPDYEDWISEASFGANKCAKFGTNSKSGNAQTPRFKVYGKTDFSFIAAPFDYDDTELTVTVSGNAKITPSTFSLKANQWTECKAVIEGDDEVCVKIKPAKRMFLDEVKAILQDPTLGVDGVKNHISAPDAPVYNMMGQKVADSYSHAKRVQLASGIYICNGKKFVVK